MVNKSLVTDRGKPPIAEVSFPSSRWMTKITTYSLLLLFMFAFLGVMSQDVRTMLFDRGTGDP
jgi:hypothetical protein